MSELHTMALTAGLAAATLLVAASPAAGQLAPKSDAPFLLDVGKIDSVPNACVTTLSGTVSVRQDRSELRANTIRLYDQRLEGGRCGDLLRIEAEGDVFYITPENPDADPPEPGYMRVRGDRAVYTASDDTIRMTGRVTSASDRGDVTESQRLSIKVSTQQVTVESEGQGRVRGVFTVPSKTEDAPQESHASPLTCSGCDVHAGSNTD